MYKLYVFDFDGVLADSGPWVTSVLNEVAATFGLRQVSDAEIEMLRGLSNREIVRFFGVSPWKMPAIARHVRARMAQDAERIGVFPGAPEMLTALRARGGRIALVSSNSEANVRRILGSAADMIDDYECGVGLFGKAGRFRRVMRRAGVLPPETLCIGDETRDIEAARKAGAASAAVTWGYATRAVLEAFNPTMLVDDIAALSRL